jgi:hypothetical protein
MRKTFLRLARVLLVGGAALIAACVGYGGGGNLQPGVAMLPDVVAAMGQPAMRWKDPDGREQLAYPRGPAGTETFMAFIDGAGRLERLEPVLNVEHFARIEAGKSDQATVLRLLGPSPSQWTTYFKARDELVWSWRICDSWNQSAFFDVLFDAPTGIVRSTQQRPDDPGGRNGPPGCSRVATR